MTRCGTAIVEEDGMLSLDENYRKDFSRQYSYAKSYLLPMLESFMSIPVKDSTVVEIGSNVGGIVCAYSEVANEAIGVEIHPERIRVAVDYAKDGGFKAKFVHRSAEDFSQTGVLADLVIMSDVLEHLDDPEKTIKNIKSILKKNSILYINFPPYFFPFAGHFTDKSTYLKYIPFAHVIFSKSFIINTLKRSACRGEWTPESMVESFLSLNRMTIRRCKRILLENGFGIEMEQHFIIPPLYKLKYNISPWPINWVKYLPFLSEILDNRFSLISKRS
jgi:2-polyprenyl-3-methyl-5-hydroxy-6-metoxy-1,4-benzoquinol methylase